MKKVLIPAFALLVFSAAANAQQKEPQKGISTAANKTVHKPAGNIASVTPKKTTTQPAATKTTTTTKKTAIKRKHHHKPKKVKSKKM